MKTIFRLSLALAILLQIQLVSTAQMVKPTNIYRVSVCSRYIIEEGKRTGKFFAVGQLFSDSLGRMHTEIDYTWDTHYPDNYRWHYFDGKNKLKTDHFLKEKLNHFYVYKYNADGKITEVSLFKVNGNDTTLLVVEAKTWDATGRLTQTIGYNNLGKKGFKTKYKYDIKGTEIERKVSGKKAVPSDSILYLKRIVTYDEKDRFATENLTIDKLGKPRSIINKQYKYDDKGNLIQEVTSNHLGQKISRKEYVYRPDNRIQTMSVFDSSDALVDFRAWRYEIYKSANRTQRVLE